MTVENRLIFVFLTLKSFRPPENGLFYWEMEHFHQDWIPTLMHLSIRSGNPFASIVRIVRTQTWLIEKVNRIMWIFQCWRMILKDRNKNIFMVIKAKITIIIFVIIAYHWVLVALSYFNYDRDSIIKGRSFWITGYLNPGISSGNCVTFIIFSAGIFFTTYVSR